MTFEEAEEIYGKPNNHSAADNLLYLIVKALMMIGGEDEDDNEDDNESYLSLDFGNVSGTDTELFLTATGVNETADIFIHKSADGSNFSAPELLGSSILTNGLNVSFFYPTDQLTAGHYYYITVQDETGTFNVDSEIVQY